MGTTIGRYEVGEEIARGGMGVVYRARGPSADRDLALKLLGDLGGHSRAFRRFQREAAALAKLDHANIVRVHEVGVHGGRPFLVMDLLEGGSLEDRLKREGALPLREAATIALALAEALAYAHSCSVLHRDVKPANVLIGPRGEPQLADFGLAKHLDPSQSKLTKTGSSMGSPAYWSPEQAMGRLQEIGPTTDVYSLGATLYELLTLQPPHQGESLIEMVAATVGEPPTPPSRLRPEIAPRLEAICLRCLEKRPSDRYATAEALAADLHAYLEAPRTSGERFGGKRAALTSAVLLTLAGGLVAALATEGGGQRPAAVAAPESRPGPAAPKPGASPSQPAPVDEVDGSGGARAEARVERSLKAAEGFAAERKWARAIVSYGQALEALGPRSERRGEIRRALARAFVKRATRRARGPDQLRALDEFTKAIRADPDLADAHFRRALLLNDLGRAQEALEDMDEYLKSETEDAPAFNLRGQLRDGLGDPLAAIRDWDRAIELDPTLHASWHSRAWVKVSQLGDPASADADYTRCLELDPEEPLNYLGRGICRVRLGRHAEAIVDFDGALRRLEPGTARHEEVKRMRSQAQASLDSGH